MNEIALADTHAHLDFEQFVDDRAGVLSRASQAGVRLIVNAGINVQSSRRSIELSRESPLIYAAVGVHPHDSADLPPDYLEQLAEMARDPRVVALGEMGLDYYRDRAPRTLQQNVLREQLRLARSVGLPVIIHDREAHDDIVRLLHEEKAGCMGGVMHCFSGDWPLAQRCLQMNMYISLAGPLTYRRDGKLVEAARKIPLERLLTETDAPFLAPQSRRGQRNEPAYVSEICRCLAAIKGISAAAAARATLSNACALFKIPADTPQP